MLSIRPFAWAALLAVGLPLSGHAGERQSAVPLLSKYQQECSSCHVPYPPGMLPAQSWQRLMRGLPNHFGTDASLDAATVQELSAWLARHAGTTAKTQAAPPEDRITRSRWFQRKHDDISPRTWQLPKIKSASNCAACHANANQGVYDEDNVHIPR